MRNPTALLVIEEPHDLETYGTFLRNRGYETLMCDSPREGMNCLAAKDVSLVIVSQGTPAFEGRPVLERALQLCPKVPVLVVARVLDIHCYLDAMDLGAFDYLEKPDPRDLAWVVDMHVLRGGSA
jgi:two-component system response regulator (stage 0 sporulation protein F)